MQPRASTKVPVRAKAKKAECKSMEHKRKKATMHGCMVAFFDAESDYFALKISIVSLAEYAEHTALLVPI